MAWVQKYESVLYDRGEVKWTVKIFEDSFGGSVTNLYGASENPLIFEFTNSEDDVFDPIKPIRATLTVWAYTMFAMADLYSVENMYHKVEIYQGENLYFSGYVDPKQYSESYGPCPYPVKIIMIDGLTLLKDMLYKYQTVDPDDTYYNGRILESQIILDILGKIGFTAFKEYVNLYEESMSTSVGDSPMDQIKIDADVFRDMYCNEVLEHILRKYGACIRQKDGIFCIYRPVELINTTVYGRYFTAATTKSAVSITPEQYINRVGQSSSRIQVPGGVVMINSSSPAKKVTIYQDYGYKDSWLDNWQFKRDTFTGSILTGFDCEFWTEAGGEIISPISAALPAESEGALIKYNDYPATSKYIYQTFGINAVVSATDVFKLEFDYLFHNLSGSAKDPVYFYLEIYSEDGHYLHIGLNDEEYGEWHAYQDQVWVGDAAPEGIPEWKHYSRTIIGLPAIGPYTVKIYGAVNANGDLIWTGIKNLKFYAISDSIVILKRKIQGPFKWFYKLLFGMPKPIVKYTDKEEIIEKIHTKENNIGGTRLEYGHVLGDTAAGIDNVIEQFAGSLATIGRDTLTQAAADFVTDHAADYSPGGVIVTSDGDDILFTSDTPGVDFTGNTIITNTSGSLDGSVENTIPNSAGQVEIDTITLTGTSGTANITCGSETHPATFNGTLAQAVADFIAAEISNGWWDAIGITVTQGTGEHVNDIIFTEQVAEGGFIEASITNTSGDLDGNIVDTQEPIEAVARVDTITLTGTSGTANILCDGVTEEVDIDETIDYSTDWNTRGGSESKELLSIIVDEIAAMYSRPKQLVQMTIDDDSADPSAINTLGNIQDTLNTLSGAGVNLMTDPDGQGSTYDTLTVSGISVTSAINLAGTAFLESNVIDFVEGDIITVMLTLTSNSGQLPSVTLVKMGVGAKSETVSLAAGKNVIHLTATGTGDAVEFSNTAAANWSTSDIYVFKNIRVFIFNRGTFDVRYRRWVADLAEIGLI